MIATDTTTCRDCGILLGAVASHPNTGQCHACFIALALVSATQRPTDQYAEAEARTAAVLDALAQWVDRLELRDVIALSDATPAAIAATLAAAIEARGA